MEWFRDRGRDQDDDSPADSDESINRLTEQLASTSVGTAPVVPRETSDSRTMASHGEPTEAAMPPIGTVIATTEASISEPIAPTAVDVHSMDDDDTPADEATDTEAPEMDKELLW